MCDLFMPRKLGPLGWSLYGGFLAAGRFATIFAVTLLVQAPAAAYAILIPGLTVHVAFGIASGYVTHHLVRAIQPKANDVTPMSLDQRSEKEESRREEQR
jgi:hypothetical protein